MRIGIEIDAVSIAAWIGVVLAVVWILFGVILPLPLNYNDGEIVFWPDRRLLIENKEPVGFTAEAECYFGIAKVGEAPTMIAIRSSDPKSDRLSERWQTNGQLEPNIIYELTGSNFQTCPVYIAPESPTTNTQWQPWAFGNSILLLWRLFVAWLVVSLLAYYIEVKQHDR